ncbi:MAG: dephospho-CoA kinase [Bacteroidetes bacterium]|nr:dephospho-CoA kinase [Bacteroidota bacterium]
MKRIGITGGIASGKSMVAEVIESLGFPVFYADAVAKGFLSSDQDVKSYILSAIGKNAWLPSGEPDRKFIASKVFSDSDFRIGLNQLIHPKVLVSFEQFCRENSQHRLIFHEAALIYQAGFDKYLDNVIFVSASEETRLNRAVRRGGDSADIQNRMHVQGNLEVFEHQSRFVIHNEGNLEELKIHVNEIIRDLLSN